VLRHSAGDAGLHEIKGGEGSIKVFSKKFCKYQKNFCTYVYDVMENIFFTPFLFGKVDLASASGTDDRGLKLYFEICIVFVYH
jgi:hypothetical protein